MRKLLVFLLFVCLAIIVAGLYGAIHNQISFTVSPEYFTKFKFVQFGLVDSDDLSEHVRASIVGILASWWMGFPIGILIGVPGFLHRGYRRMISVLTRSMGLAVGFILVFGLCGLAYGFLQTADLNLSEYKNWYIPSGLSHPRRFICAGYMHNSAYLGGLLAIMVAWIYQFVARSGSGNKDLAL